MAGTPTFTDYDFNQLSIVLGAILIDGFAEDSAITIERDSDGFTKYTGCDGRTTRARTNNRCTKVTFRLAQSSATNDQLSALYMADLLTPGGAGVVPLAVTDGSGRSFHESTYAWISRLPDVTYSNGVEVREWTVETAAMDELVGGN